MSEIRVNTIDTKDNTSLSIQQNNTTALTIDTSQNVGIGTTSPSVTFDAEADGATVAHFNRTTDDGSVIDIQKDGTTEGSIGISFSRPYFANDTIGIKLGSTFDLRPTNSSGTNNDNAIDLGVSSVRFRHLYLGGNIYLGGTGSANALDDYEEGTFTVGTYSDATGVLSSESGEYTKIGNVVHVRIIMTVSTNFTGTAIDGLPFTADHDTSASSVLATNAFLTLSNTNGVIYGKIPNGGSRIEMIENNNFNDAHSPNTSNSTYRISLWYYSA